MQPDGKKHDFAGMTVNERLFDACLLKQFDDAARRRDRAGMIALLCQVELSKEDATQAVEHILTHPEKYLWHLRAAK